MYRLIDQPSGYLSINSTILSAAVAAALVAGVAPQIGIPLPVFDPVWGGGEVIFARAGGAIPLKQLVSLLPVWDSTARNYRWDATPVANTAIMGRPVAVALADSAMASGDYGYFLVSGIAPVSGTASVAADTTCSITAAGQIGALAAGKQIVNARVIQAATATVALAGCTGISGDNVINVPNTDGLFVGGYLSGTGVGAAAIISLIDPMGKYIIATVVNSAAISGTVTQTANNATIFYNVLHVNRPFAQGAIT